MEKQRWLAFFLGYAVPGLGHIYLGKKGKGIFFLLTLYTTFLIGFSLANFHYVAPFERDIDGQTSFRYTFIPQAGIGLLAWGIALSTRMTIVITEEEPRTVPPERPIGMLYMMIAGLLNLLVAQRAYELCWEEQEWEKILSHTRKGRDND